MEVDVEDDNWYVLQKVEARKGFCLFIFKPYYRKRSLERRNKMAKDLSKMSTDELVDELLKLKLDDLKRIQPDSPEYKDAMYPTLALYRAQTDGFRLQVEADAHQLEASNEKKKGWREFLLGLLGIAIPTAVYGVLWRAGMKFEETGTISSSGMRRLNNELKLLK